MNPTRRAFLATLAFISCTRRTQDSPNEGEAAPRFRLAICNETFQGWDFQQSCRGVLDTGYTGVEIAPFTLSEDPANITPTQRSEYRKIMSSEGVEYVGLHSLLTVPRGQLHITTPDETVRKRSWEYFRELIELCADLGDNGVMILGSGKQRRTVDGSSVEDATRRLQEGLASVAPHAQSRGVTILPETLAPHLCDVLTSLDETVAMVKAIDSPAVRTMFDTHNAAAEKEPHGQLIKKYADYIEHVHINEMDGWHPGTGNYDFSIVLRALREIGYSRWLSLEVFQFEPSGEEIARRSTKFIREVEAKLNAERA